VSVVEGFVDSVMFEKAVWVSALVLLASMVIPTAP
jgi:hypothetical protein